LFQLAEEFAGKEQQVLHRMSVNTAQNSNNKRKWCQIGYCTNNKTNNICDRCKKYVCGKFNKVSISICTNCFEW